MPWKTVRSYRQSAGADGRVSLTSSDAAAPYYLALPACLLLSYASQPHASLNLWSGQDSRYGIAGYAGGATGAPQRVCKVAFMRRNTRS